MPTGIYNRTDFHKTILRQNGFKLGEKKQPFSVEHKEKLSIAGVGKIPWNKGKKFPELSKENHRLWKGGKEAHKCIDCGGIIAFYAERCLKCAAKYKSGENHPNWQGGITPENLKIRNGIEYRLWREAVFARDNWTDQKTGVKGGNLVAHHIQNFAQFPELRTSISNGITFSQKSHQEFHKRYGNRNNTREQLEEFLQAKK